jgi:hypothetical protein
LNPAVEPRAFSDTAPVLFQPPPHLLMAADPP